MSTGSEGLCTEAAQAAVDQTCPEVGQADVGKTRSKAAQAAVDKRFFTEHAGKTSFCEYRVHAE